MKMARMMVFDVAAPPPDIFTGRETMASFGVFILENRASAPGIFAEKVSHLKKIVANLHRQVREAFFPSDNAVKHRLGEEKQCTANTSGITGH